MSDDSMKVMLKFQMVTFKGVEYFGCEEELPVGHMNLFTEYQLDNLELVYASMDEDGDIYCNGEVIGHRHDCIFGELVEKELDFTDL